MDFLSEIEEYLNSNDLSIEMLNLCKECFQHGGFGDKEEEIFKKMMIEKAKSFFPSSSLEVGEILAQLCINRGVLEIKDILFIDDAIFVEEKGFYSYEELLYIDFIGSTGSFRYSEPGEFLSVFANSPVEQEKRNKFAHGLHKIFKEYFNNPFFPEAFEEIQQGYYYFTFAISCDEEKIMKACEENKKINFTIINRINNTNSCRLVELAYLPDNEVVLEVLNCKEDNVIRLSNMIKSKYQKTKHK